MIWLFLATYALAGATIGRMAWEFDVFDDEEALTYDHRADRRLCIISGILWPLVPAWGLWIALTASKE